MAEEKDLREKDLGELRAAAQAVVDMVDPPEEGTKITKTLVERLQEAPQKIVGYLADNTNLYVVHVLGLFKSYCREANLVPPGEGMAVECSEENITKF